MSAEAGRPLANARMRRILLAIQQDMGRSGLTTIARQAGLARYAAELPPNNHDTELHAADYAALLQAIENYYGRGARGTLNRIGHSAFRQLLASAPLRARGYRLLSFLLPLQARQRLALSWLASELAAPGGQVSVLRDGRHLALVDRESDATHGRVREAEICWLTLGEIQEALLWATGSEYDVSEVSCRAKGDAVCRFEVGEALSELSALR